MDICLQELIDLFKDFIEPSATPTPKRLKDEYKAPVRKSPNGMAAVYPNGYALYDNGTGDSVIWIKDCLTYTYKFLCGLPGIIPTATSIPEETLRKLPWYIGVTLMGEDAITYNLFNRKGDRYGSRTEVRGNSDDADVEEAARWHNGFRYETPECRAVRKAQIKDMLGRLTPLQRETVILYELYGYTEPEIAAMRRAVKGKYSVAAVSKHLWEARERLKYRKIPF